jgi:hypothetical protein
MSAAGRYEHVVAAVEVQICAEAFKVAQYEDVDAETAAGAKARWDDWAVLYDALNDGLMDELHAKYTARRTLIRGAA